MVKQGKNKKKEKKLEDRFLFFISLVSAQVSTSYVCRPFILPDIPLNANANNALLYMGFNCIGKNLNVNKCLIKK